MRELLWSRRKKDFRIDWFSGTGAGGQHRNKHQNCCRITDIETGLSVTGQAQRSRIANFRHAFRRLVDLLVEHYNTKKSERCDRSIFGGGEQVRTYHELDDRVVDHATGKRYSYRHTVGRGDIGQMITDRCRHESAKRWKR